jgi:hypothetical protein
LFVATLVDESSYLASFRDSFFELCEALPIRITLFLELCDSLHCRPEKRNATCCSSRSLQSPRHEVLILKNQAIEIFLFSRTSRPGDRDLLVLKNLATIACSALNPAGWERLDTERVDWLVSNQAPCFMLATLINLHFRKHCQDDCHHL